jgi:GT2 family glycosyltransferase
LSGNSKELLRQQRVTSNQQLATSWPLVSIIIPHWRGQKILQRCVASLRRLNYQPIEILLIDNGCDDGSIAVARQEFPEVRVIATGENLGFAGGCNLGLRTANGKYALLLNDDAEATADFLAPLVEMMESDTQIAVCQPKIRSLEFPEKFDYAGANGGFLDMFGFPFCRGRIFMTLEDDRGQYDEPCDIFWASGACCLLRLCALQHTGLLDVGFFAHMEEIDLNWRLHLAGYRLVSVPASVVRHQAGTTLHPDTPFKIYLNHRNGLIMMMKNYAVSTLLWALPGRLLLDWIAFWYRLLHFDFRRALAIVRAGLHVLIHLRGIYARRQWSQKWRRVSDREITSRLYRRSIVWDYFIADRKFFLSFQLWQWQWPDIPLKTTEEKSGQAASEQEAIVQGARANDKWQDAINDREQVTVTNRHLPLALAIAPCPFAARIARIIAKRGSFSS